jgi:type I restriction enzyme S subunit
MNIKQGYKQTEIGIIPEDWEAKKFGDVTISCSSGATPYRGRPEYYKGKVKWITSGELNYNLITDTIEHISEEAVRNTNLKTHPVGTFLIAITGLEAAGTRGSCGIVGNPATTNQSCMAIYPTSELLTSYLYHYYVYRGNELAFRYCQGTKQQSYTAKLVKLLPIHLPPLKEQTAIATALSDIDALIGELDKLIAKKQGIKQATMQQLLTGKKRLAGFSGEWEVKRLGDVADIIGGGTPSTFVSNYWNGNINWFTPTEIGTEKYVFDSVRKITKDGLINCSAKILPIGTILLTTRAGIGDISILKKEACTNQGFQSFVTKDSFYNEFLYYLISTLKNVLIQNASGSTFLEISPNKIKQIQISIPTIEEQTAIATILSDMDAEISQLEGRRAKMGELKQGMMQELLTGRIRLI